MRRGVRQGTKPGRGGEEGRARQGEAGGERARIGRHGANGEGERGTRAERGGGADGDEEQSVPSSPLRYGFVPRPYPVPPSADIAVDWCDLALHPQMLLLRHAPSQLPLADLRRMDDAHVAMGAYSSKVGYISGVR
jgi:hypothetical protein